MFKEKVVSLKNWWHDHKEPIKFTIGCIGLGTIIGGFGMAKIMSDVNSKLIDEIPYKPDEVEIWDYIADNIDDYIPYIEQVSDEPDE